MAYDFIGIGNGAGYAELGLKVSEQVLPKLFADVAYLKGYMVDGRYEAEGQNFASIVIPTLKRPQGRFHSMKDVSFNPYEASRDRTAQGHIQLDIDQEYDEVIDLPEAMVVQNVIGGQLASKMAEYVAKNIAEEINYLTCEAMVKGASVYASGKPLDERKIAYLGASDVVPDKFAELKAQIGNADPAGWTDLDGNVVPGDTSFNGVPMSAVICNSLEARLLKTKDQFILESSYGQEILVEGTFGRITLADNVAYRGRIQGINMFALPDGFFPSATNTAFSHKPASGKVLGVMAVAEATYRVFVDKGIKISDATLYRGWILQPLYRLGVKVAKPWGVGLLVSDDYADENLQAPAMTKIEMEAGTTAAGYSKFKTLTGPSGAAFLYKKGTAAEVIKINKKYANGTDSWTTATAGSTEVASCTAGQVITVVAVVASGNDEGKVLASGTHTLVEAEIKSA